MIRPPQVRYTIIFLLLTLQYTSAMARILPDSSYVRSFPGTLVARTFVGEKISTFRLTDREQGRSLQFYPNNNLSLGLGVTIYGIGLNVSTILPFHDDKTDLYGKTRRLDIQVHRYARKLMLDGYLQRYRGFHLTEKSEVTSIIGPEEYPYFPHLRALTVGVAGLYVFNGERYSLNAMTNQTEWQLRSSGSALLGASVFSHLFDDSSVIPRFYKYPDFFAGHRPKEIHYYGLTVNAGYGYTLVPDKASHYFIACAADFGAGPGYSSARDVNDEQLNHITYCLSANVRIGGGYNSGKWFAGVYGIYHTDYYPLPYIKSALSTSQGIARLVVARRLSTKKRFLAKQPKTLQEQPAPPGRPPAQQAEPAQQQPADR